MTNNENTTTSSRKTVPEQAAAAMLTAINERGGIDELLRRNSAGVRLKLTFTRGDGEIAYAVSRAFWELKEALTLAERENRAPRPEEVIDRVETQRRAEA